MERIDIPYFEGVNSFVESNVAKRYELLFAINVRSGKIGSTEKRKGITRVGNNAGFTDVFALKYFNSSNASTKNLYNVSTVSGTTAIRYLNSSDTWTALTGAGAGLAAAEADITIAEGKMYVVNGDDDNLQVDNDGTTVTTANNTASDLYNSPVANKINYYKNRLYVADYTVGTTRYKNGVMFSSEPLGLLSLVDGDHDAGSTEIKLTDTKYIRNTDSLDIYRGGTKIETLTVTDKQEYAITVSSTSSALLSSDEVWVAGTYGGDRQFRWTDNPAGGVDAKTYDTFRISTGEGERVKMMTNVGDVMVIANNNGLAMWNDYNLTNFDIGVGCVSDKGYGLVKNTLYFVHYTGVYATTGGVPQLLSSKVDDYFKGATKSGLENAAVGGKGYSVFVSIGDVTLYNPDGSVYTTHEDVVLEYNIRQQNWYVHTNIPADMFATWIDGDDTDKLAFHYDGGSHNVFNFLESTSDKTSDGDTEIEIPIEVTMQYIYLQSKFEQFSYPKRVIAEVDQGQSLLCYVSLDDEPFYQIQGSLKRGIVTLIVTPRSSDEEEARCRKLRVSFRESSSAPVKIKRVAIEYTPQQEVDMDEGYND